MSIDLSSLKVLIKKIFPPKKCIYTADTNMDGSPDSVVIRAYNIVIPFVIPEKILFEDLNQEDLEKDDFDLSEYLNISFDGSPLELQKRTIDKNSIQENFRIKHQNEIFTFQQVLDGKMGGRTFGLGDTIDIIIGLKEEDLSRLTPGKHTLKLESEMFQELTIDFELSNKNINIKYDVE
ncbi:MAG: hypothetical protein P8Y97_16595 [Candidatus Lokiarchaeota archaeon]